MPLKHNDSQERDGSTYQPQARARINAGLCNKCGDERGEDGTAIWCRACARRQVEYIRELRRRRIAAGLCIGCGHERDGEGQRCGACAAKNSASANAYYRRRLAR